MISSALISSTTRFAASLAAAGFLFAAAPAAAQTQLPPPAYGNADARQDRIEELEAQLRDATAENERMQYELMQRDREITRLRGMVGELAGVNQDLSTGQPVEGETPAPGTTPRLQDGDQESSLNEAQRRATGTLGTMPASTAPVQAAEDPGEAYSRAREMLVNGQLAEAEAAFGGFLERHPNASTAADARFWFAFTLLARHNYEDAAANFVQYLQNNASAPRAPEAQVRLGMALIGMGNRQQGCAAFGSLTRRYPNAPRNVRDLATREARAAQCSA